MDIEDLVRDHYSGTDLEDLVLAALERVGVDVDALSVEDLAGLDQLHAGSGAATAYLLDRLEFGVGETVLDVGCGIGGAARLAGIRGSQVTGIDLSPDFVDLARALTARIGLDDGVRFDVGSATALPYDDRSFTRAMLIHAGMNIPDKAQVFREVRRVLESGGRFAVYEQMRIADGALTYPMPWADDGSASFVETSDRYRELLEAAGFRVESEEDRTAANVAGGLPPAGALTPGDLFGPGFPERITNNITAAMNGILGAVLMIAHAD